MRIFISRKGRKGNDDDKTISQKDDKTHKCALGAHYLALSRKAPDLCSIFANRKTENYPPPPPLRGTRPCLRGRVSDYRLVATSAVHHTPALGRGPSINPLIH